MKQFLIISLLVLISTPFVWPFFQKGFIESDDGMWAVVRQASMHAELRQGQLPVRWSGALNYGYGYPLFNFSYPGPYYLGEFFKVLGFNYIWTVKLLFVTGTIASVIGMYIFAKELWRSELAGFIAALFYLVGPYRLTNTYIRGSLGEIIAFALFPFICYAAIKLLATGKRRYLLSGAMLIALLIISHNIMALLFIPFFIIFVIGEIILRYAKFSVLIKAYIEKFQNRNKGFKDNVDKKLFLNHIHLVITMMLIGISLSAFFWIPALAELKYTRLSVHPLTDIRKEFSKTKGLLITPFDNRTEYNNVLRLNFVNGMIYTHITVVFSVIVLILFYRKNYHVASHRILLYLLGYLVACALLSPSSEFLWRYIPGLKLIDFPWRMYGILLFVQPVIIAAVALIPRVQYIGIALAIIPLLYGISAVGTIKHVDYPDSFYSTNQGTTTSASEYLNKWVNTPIENAAPAFLKRTDAASGEFTFSIKQNKSTDKKVTYTATQSEKVQLGLMYFPGWNVRLDGKETPFTYQDSNGFISVLLPEGSHTLDLKFQDTSARIAGNILTIVTLLLVIIIFSIQYIRGKRFVI